MPRLIASSHYVVYMTGRHRVRHQCATRARGVMGDQSPMDVQDGANLPRPPTDDKSGTGGNANPITPPQPVDELTGEEGAKRMRTATGGEIPQQELK